MRAGVFVLAAVALAGCGGSDETAQDTSSPAPTPASVSVPTESVPTDTATAEASDDSADPQMFPDVIGAEAIPSGDNTWSISATLSSPYDTPQRYADAWRVVGPDGTVFGERILGHDHAAEQPFTRSQSGIEIPADVTEVTIEGRDQQFGWGGATFQLVLAVD